MAGSDRYAQRIRGEVSAFWRAAITRDEFLSGMGIIIMAGLEAAFAEGAAECDITPEDYSDAEERVLRDVINQETGELDGLADAIEGGSRANGGKLAPLLTRAETWAMRYDDVVGRGKVMACEDQKFVWVLGQTEHCATCARLEGLVKRGSFWRNYVMPRNPPNEQLECGGWRCQCNLELTSERVSRRTPAVP